MNTFIFGGERLDDLMSSRFEMTGPEVPRPPERLKVNAPAR